MHHVAGANFVFLSTVYIRNMSLFQLNLLNSGVGFSGSLHVSLFQSLARALIPPTPDFPGPLQVPMHYFLYVFIYVLHEIR